MATDKPASRDEHEASRLMATGVGREGLSNESKSPSSIHAQQTDPLVRKTLEAAHLFLTLGSRYAPNENIADQNKATDEWLRTCGLAGCMLLVAGQCQEAIATLSKSSSQEENSK